MYNDLFNISELDTACIPVISEEKKIQFSAAEREERWLLKRVGKITSSTLPDLMKGGKGEQAWGKTSIKVMLAVADEMISGQRRPSIKGVKALEFGHTYEEEALEYYNKVTGLIAMSGTYGFEDILFIQPFEGFGDSPDAYIAPAGTAEIKCPENGAIHLDYCGIKAIHERSDYYWQFLGHLLDPAKEWCDFVSYNPRYPDEHPLKIHIVRVWKKDHAFNIELLQNRIETALTWIYRAVEENNIDYILNINNNDL